MSRDDVVGHSCGFDQLNIYIYLRFFRTPLACVEYIYQVQVNTPAVRWRVFPDSNPTTPYFGSCVTLRSLVLRGKYKLIRDFLYLSEVNAIWQLSQGLCTYMYLSGVYKLAQFIDRTDQNTILDRLQTGLDVTSN